MNPNTENTTYLAVEPLPPVAPIPAPAYAPPVAAPPAWEHLPPIAPATSDVPEWEQHVPPPPIAQVVPAQTIDGAAYRAHMRGEQFAPQGALPVHPATPQPSPTYNAPQHPQQYAPAPHAPVPPPQASPYPVSVPPLRAPQSASPGFGVQTAQYSPFRDDKNGYALVAEHRGISYFLKEMSDAVQQFANTFERRFAADPRNRVVDVLPTGPKIERSIALEELIGGEIEWFGEKIQLAPNAVYERYPELQGHLTVRSLSVEEVADERNLMIRYPSTYKKLVAAKEVMYADVLEACLAGWSIAGVEVNRHNINRLAYEVKRAVFLRLGAGSVMGLNEDDYFRGANERDSASG